MDSYQQVPMKPVKVIWLILLLLAGAVIAGVLIGTVNIPEPSDAAATNATDPLAYHEEQTPQTPVPARPPLRGVPAHLIVPPRAIQQLHPPHPLVAGTRPILNRVASAHHQGPDDPFAAARERMIQEQLIGRGITDPAVLQAMRSVPRQSFTPLAADAYMDRSLDYGNGRIMETPFVIATTAEQLAAEPDDRILDVQAAPGYATAVYSLLVKQVYATQSFHAQTMAMELQALGFTNNVYVRQADAGQGWPEAAPFDAIVFNGPLDQVTENLLAQLKSGGRLIIPVTDGGKLCVLKKYGNQLVLQTQIPVRPTPIPDNQVVLPSYPPAIHLLSH